MLEALGPGTRLGYCTNVHAGHDIAATLANLERHAVGVRERLGVPELGIGLWLSADAARQAIGHTTIIRKHLNALGLRVFTLNGFPYADFHEPVVKHRVYEPSWSDPRRLHHTLNLVSILHDLLPDADEGSISTLPLGWPAPPCAPVDLEHAANALRALALHLERLESTTGRLIHIDLEPEPGCILQRSEDVVNFWDAHLRRGPKSTEDAVRRHLRVCHDVCHAAVMFEPQHQALENYRQAGIGVGKVQISSALRVPAAGADELRQFVEPRYLHQTCIRDELGVHAYQDLPLALDSAERRAEGEWRVHFHVPLNLEATGSLRTTNDDIPDAVRLALRDGVRHFEVETYAWSVLPPELQDIELADGIANELCWVVDRCDGAPA